jgi:hypothetical protein
MTDLFKAFGGEEYVGQQTSYPWMQIVSKDELDSYLAKMPIAPGLSRITLGNHLV